MGSKHGKMRRLHNIPLVSINLFITLLFECRSLIGYATLRLVHNVVVAFGKVMSVTKGEVLCSITNAKLK